MSISSLEQEVVDSVVNNINTVRLMLREHGDTRPFEIITCQLVGDNGKTPSFITEDHRYFFITAKQKVIGERGYSKQYKQDKYVALRFRGGTPWSSRDDRKEPNMIQRAQSCIDRRVEYLKQQLKTIQAIAEHECARCESSQEKGIYCNSCGYPIHLKAYIEYNNGIKRRCSKGGDCYNCRGNCKDFIPNERFNSDYTNYIKEHPKDL